MLRLQADTHPPHEQGGRQCRLPAPSAPYSRAQAPRAGACPLRRFGGTGRRKMLRLQADTHLPHEQRPAACVCVTQPGAHAGKWRIRARGAKAGLRGKGEASGREDGGIGGLAGLGIWEFGDLGIWGFGNLGIRSLAWGQGSVSPRAAMLAPQAARAAAENKPLVRLVRKYASAHRRPPFPVPAIHPCCRPPRRRRGHGGFPARPIFRAAHPRCPPTPPFAPLCAFAPSHRIQFNVSSHIFPPVVL